MSLSLVERLGADPMRSTVVTDCVNLIDAQVKSKGLGIRTAYGAIKMIKRGFVPDVVQSMLDEWLEKLQPHYDRWSASQTGGNPNGSFAEFLVARSDDVAEDLLKVTDARAEKTKHTTAKKYYVKMRPQAKTNVIEAIPDLAKTIEKRLAAN